MSLTHLNLPVPDNIGPKSNSWGQPLQSAPETHCIPRNQRQLFHAVVAILHRTKANKFNRGRSHESEKINGENYAIDGTFYSRYFYVRHDVPTRVWPAMPTSNNIYSAQYFIAKVLRATQKKERHSAKFFDKIRRRHARRSASDINCTSCFELIGRCIFTSGAIFDLIVPGGFSPWIVRMTYKYQAKISLFLVLDGAILISIRALESVTYFECYWS